MSKQVAFSFAVTVALLVAPQESQAADRYIRPASTCSVNGNGTSHTCATSGGGSGAFNSWVFAMEAMLPGDTLRVDGEFREVAIRWTKSGTAASPIRITSKDPSRRALLQSSDNRLAPLAVPGSYVHIDSLRFRNDYDGVGEGSDDMGTCLVIKQPNSAPPPSRGVRVINNLFEKCNNGISLAKTEDVEIRQNRLELIGEADDGHGHCIYPAQVTKNIRVLQNLCVARADLGSAHCLHVFHGGPAADSVDFHDNVCVGFTVGVGVYNGATNIQVYNNTFTGLLRSYGARCDFGGATGYVRNNIFSGTFRTAASIDSGCKIEFDNNLYHRTDGPLVFNELSKPLTWDQWKERRDKRSITGSPLLTDSAKRDFSLSVSSPARNRGDNTYTSTTDFMGNKRIFGSTVDLGAIESDSTASPGITPSKPQEFVVK